MTAGKKDELMSASLVREWPYYFCPQCGRLAPVQYMGGVRVCLKCNYTFEKEEGGRVVLFSPKEARLRHLEVIKDDTTGELE